MNTSPSAAPPPLSRRLWAYERGKFWAKELSGKEPPFERIPAMVPASLEQASPEGVEGLIQAMGGMETRPILQRFASGRRCFIAVVGAEIASYCWVSTINECIGEMEREIHLPPGEAYIWDCATRPGYRGMHLYTALLSHIVAGLRQEGLRRAWIGSSLDNKPSLKAFAHAGFQPVMRVLYTRLLALGVLLMAKSPVAPAGLVSDAWKMLRTEQDHAWGPYLIRLSGPPQLSACLQAGS